MNKGIIVVDDIPVICAECERAEIWSYKLYCLEEDRVINNSKPDWCPIKIAPQRANHENYCDGGRYDKGFNDCLDEIFGREK